MTDSELQKIEDIATKFPLGAHVRFYPIDDERKHELAQVRSEPWALGSGHIVLKITGRTGGVLVDHLERDEQSERIAELEALLRGVGERWRLYIDTFGEIDAENYSDRAFCDDAEMAGIHQQGIQITDGE